MTESSPAELKAEQETFEAIGLTQEKAKETAGNKKLCAALMSCLQETVKLAGCDKTMGSLFYELASAAVKDQEIGNYRSFIAQQIASGSLKSKEQVLAAGQFVKKLLPGEAVDSAAFVRFCGVGVEVGIADIEKLISDLVLDRKAAIVEERYKSLPVLLKSVREHDLLKWADGKAVKDQIDVSLLQLLGPKDERDVPQKKKKEKKQPSAEDLARAEAVPAKAVWTIDFENDQFFKQGELSKLHKVGENKQIRPELMEQHLRETGCKMMTRFPPEPNGHLHIGHAKAINVNFGYALANKGLCYLRYDDTNPEAEEKEYFDSILDSVQWLGYTPWKVTYSSDHFQKLYDLAVQLIKSDKAYVCHCTGEEIHEQRGGDSKGARFDSPWRNRPIEESLKEFQRMKDGYYKEGEAILRMKMDMQNPNPQFWDLVAYRVMFVEHFRSGKDWCMYPTYDYTHCLCDSFENITHSLCTTEFRASRESYYWLCDAVEVYKPVQWEYGRLNITRTVLSKRKLTKLVQNKIVDGWDDPRLYTLIALKRRGFPPQAINKFVRDCGVTTADSVIDVRKLEHTVRQYLDDHVPRVMAITEPLPVMLSNLPTDFYHEIRVPFMPKSKQNPTLNLPESRLLPFTNVIFVEQSDFKENAANDANFFRLSVGSTVGILNAEYPIYCKQAIKNTEGKVVALECLYLDPETVKTLTEKQGVTAARLKPKAHIQWLALSHPTPAHPKRISSPCESELRLYNDLFLHDNPMDKVEVPGGWLTDINPNSLQCIKGFVESGVGPSDLNLTTEGKVQFVRTGYFCVDRETKVQKADVEIMIPRVGVNGVVSASKETVNLTSGWVWNRTVLLKEDSAKN